MQKLIINQRQRQNQFNHAQKLFQKMSILHLNQQNKQKHLGLLDRLNQDQNNQHNHNHKHKSILEQDQDYDSLFSRRVIQLSYHQNNETYYKNNENCILRIKKFSSNIEQNDDSQQYDHVNEYGNGDNKDNEDDENDDDENDDDGNHDLGNDSDQNDNQNDEDDINEKDDKKDQNEKDNKERKIDKNNKGDQENKNIKDYNDKKYDKNKKEEKIIYQNDKDNKDILSQIWTKFKNIISWTYDETFNKTEQKQVSHSQIQKLDKEVKQLQIYQNERTSMIIKHQVSSQLWYTKKLQSPIFPGGMSGVTIGIGYDLGQCSIKQFQLNWKSKLTQDHYKILKKCIGLKGEKTKIFLNQNKNALNLIKIPIKTAKQVLNNILQYYQKTIQENYPKLKQKYPNTYNSLVCMHYNRGFSKKQTKNYSRRQIILIDQVLSGKKQTNLPIPEFVAKQILSMCRIWQKDKSLIGLIKRRHQQAENCMKDIQIKK